MKNYSNTFYRFGTGINDIELHGNWNGWIMIDSHASKDMVNAKRTIREFILNGSTSENEVPGFLMYLKCILDGTEIELSMLSRETQVKILDELLFANCKCGEIIEYAEIVNDENYDD